MARKVIGYIELVWTCDSCGTRNPGAIRSCTACGAPQPVDVKFERVDPSTFNFIKDEALIRMAKSGPDKHCPYCGTRNLAEAQTCVECGGDLTVGATSRPAGVVLEEQADQQPLEAGISREPKPVKPLPKWVLILAVLFLLALCYFGGMYISQMNKTDRVNATVSQAYWQRQVVLEAYQLVQSQAWLDDIPPNAQAYNCKLTYRYNSETQLPNSEEVCGEPYTIDTGTGIGEVVQDCYFKVYEDYCSYDTMQWVAIDTLSLDGYGTEAQWPTANLNNAQRLGSSTESYVITFSGDGTEYRYNTSDYELFQTAYPGSNWVIEVNGFGNITGLTSD
mgnify:FL=1|jgi:hypothetical protein